MKNLKVLIFSALISTVPLFGDSIGLGYISNLADSPTGGLQELTINNLTGPANCQATEYTACTNVNFTNWTLTVKYNSSYYAGTQTVYTDGGSSPNGGFGDITPSSTNNIFDFDLCGGASSCPDPDHPVTVITSVEFAGQISPTNICLYDASATPPGCNATNPTTFFANSAFDMIWNATSAHSPDVNEDTNPFTQSPDITVSDQSSPSGVPEPGTFFLMTALLPLARFARRRKSAI